MDTEAYVERARDVAAAASFTDMGDRGHYLLRGVSAWNSFAVDRVSSVLGVWHPCPPLPTGQPESSSGVRMKLSCFIR